MVGFLIFAGIIGAIVLIGWVINLVEEHRKNIREQVANEVFGELNIDTIVKNYKAKLVHINYIKPEWKQENSSTLNTPQSNINDLLMQECPKCKIGRLIPRHGKYGRFIGCSAYPNCVYTNNGKQPRQEYKDIINSQVMKDIHKAYSDL